MSNIVKWVAAVALALGATVGTTESVRAAPAALSLRCALPDSRQIVGCSLTGRGFHPRERLRLTYTVTFTALPRRHGHLQRQVYVRTTMSDGHGRFARPPLRFGVVRYHESYRLTATAAGASGDRASITYVAIAQ